MRRLRLTGLLLAGVLIGQTGHADTIVDIDLPTPTLTAEPVSHLPGDLDHDLMLNFSPEVTRAAVLPADTALLARAPSVARLGLSTPTPLDRPRRLELLANPPRSMRGQDDIGCMALALYHEARGESEAGQRAVASVILRRAEVDRWGDDVCGVVVPVQFSFVRRDYSTPRITEPDAWEAAVDLAIEMIEHGPDPALRGADHYHAYYVSPRWRHYMTRVVQIEKHIFYVDPNT